MEHNNISESPDPKPLTPMEVPLPEEDFRPAVSQRRATQENAAAQPKRKRMKVIAAPKQIPPTPTPVTNKFGASSNLIVEDNEEEKIASSSAQTTTAIGQPKKPSPVVLDRSNYRLDQVNLFMSKLNISDYLLLLSPPHMEGDKNIPRDGAGPEKGRSQPKVFNY